MLWQCIRNLLVFQVEKVLDFTSFLGRFDHRGDLFIDRWTESKFCKELFTVFQLHCSDRIQILALYQSSVCSFGCQGHGIVLFMIICNLNFDQMEGLQNKSWKGKDEETRDDRHRVLGRGLVRFFSGKHRGWPCSTKKIEWGGALKG